MAIDSITIHLTDGIKQGDYAPNKVYDLTAILTNPGRTDVDDAVDVIVRAGERFLGRAPVAAPTATRKPREPKAEERPTTAPPAESQTPVSDPLQGGPATLASSGGTEAGTPATSGDISDILGDPEPAAEIDNETLKDAVMKRSEALKDGLKIRALVESYNPAPGLRVFKATEIAQKDRPEFLVKLAAL